MPNRGRYGRPALAWGLLAALALPALSCGGGGGVGVAGQGLVLTNFHQGGQDNLPINRILRFTFSEAVDPASVKPASIQIRKGGDFGLTAQGTFRVDGSDVYFEPRLPTECGGADAGFLPATTYRVTLLGFPEAFCVMNSHGQPLEQTSTHEFTTRPESDPGYLEDQIPAAAPAVTAVTPGQCEAGVAVEPGNVVRIAFSENLDPCSLSPASVRFLMYEVGDASVNNVIPAGEPNEGNTTGFTPWDDQVPEDPTSWGPSGTPLVPPQVIPADLVLVQDFSSTVLEIRPGFGRFPENALCVVELTFDIVDFGGYPLTPASYCFTTENLDPQTGALRVEFDTSQESWPQDTRTIDVDTPRSPSLLQAWMLFSGDGDNGTNLLTPARPGLASSGCPGERQTNDGNADDFDPASDVVLDTDATVNTCKNSVDGSTAVVWEFRSFRIRSGVTVRIVGANPAIILAQDEIVIESGGRLLARGDGQGGSPRGQGGDSSATNTNGTKGGVAVAGGGDGGDGPAYPAPSTGRYGDDGVQGYYTESNGNIAGDVGDAPGVGGGEGNTSGYWNTQTVCNRNVPSGGGGGHATVGGDGTALGSGTSPVSLDLELRGGGGGTYANETRMMRPEAGSGGGAGGELRSYAGTAAVGPGGGGGAGGGFVDLTCGGNILINGTIDAAGSPGGKGAGNPFNPNYTYNPGTGGGGGGSGGGIRILSAREIIVGATAVITAAGGAGGPGGTNQGTAQPVNDGGAGGVGRVVLEDADSVIVGLSTATVIPGEGQEGFYRGAFDSTRFKGGGLDGHAISGPILVGPLSPVTFQAPVAADFRCVIPANASIPPNGTSILIEAAGYPIRPDGTVDLSVGDHWYTIGYFANSGAPNDPTWVAGSNPPDMTVTNDGAGIHNLYGSAYVRFRISTCLPPTVTPETPGPCLDWMEFHFTYDQ